MDHFHYRCDLVPEPPNQAQSSSSPYTPHFFPFFFFLPPPWFWFCFCCCCCCCWPLFYYSYAPAPSPSPFAPASCAALGCWAGARVSVSWLEASEMNISCTFCNNSGPYSFLLAFFIRYWVHWRIVKGAGQVMSGGVQYRKCTCQFSSLTYLNIIIDLNYNLIVRAPDLGNIPDTLRTLFANGLHLGQKRIVILQHWLWYFLHHFL